MAEASTVADVEAVVRAYRLYQSQERRPPEAGVVRRGLRIRRLGDGMARVEAVLTDVEAAELEAVLRALIDRASRPGTPHDHGDDDRDGEESSCENPDDRDGEESSCEDPDDRPGDTPSGEATAEDPGADTGGEAEAGHQSSREDSLTGAEGPVSWPQRHADALTDLVRSGIVAYGGGADRHLAPT